MKLAYFIAFLALLPIFTPASPLKQASIKEKHLLSYTQDCLEHWFYPNQANNQLKSLAKNIVAAIQSAPIYETQWNWELFIYEIVYPIDYVEQLIRGSTLEFIQAESYAYAREITDRSIADQIARVMYNHLFDYCAHYTELPLGAFANYIGAGLRTIVYNYYYQTYVYLPA